MIAIAEQKLPYGTNEIEPRVICLGQCPRRVRCFVRGCKRVVLTPTRYAKGEPCPDHGIFCHFSSGGATYSYADVRRNAIVSPDLLATRIVHHPFKYESHRLGAERSEDMLYLERVPSLFRKPVAWAGSHGPSPATPAWSNRFSISGASASRRMNSIRGICWLRPGRDLNPIFRWSRPLTEPDIGIILPGRYLILIEAKFTSPNTSYQRGGRANPQSLTLEGIAGDLSGAKSSHPGSCSVQQPGRRSIISFGGT